MKKLQLYVFNLIITALIVAAMITQNPILLHIIEFTSAFLGVMGALLIIGLQTKDPTPPRMAIWFYISGMTIRVGILIAFGYFFCAICWILLLLGFQCAKLRHEEAAAKKVVK